ncbi:enoyl-CoA hydratase/isomerase family protein [Pelagibius sp.]|uniref:enoyl-CoA hydratase/isomerase family protein n=1 Tax=Pelagibius sp. TaxID=1931238 RepID=UPI003BAE637E
MTEPLAIRKDGSITILELNRPDKLNALNTELTQQLVDALVAADRHDSVHVIVLAGAGRGFCAGADLKEFSHLTTDNPETVRKRAELTFRLQSLLPEIRKPIIAAAQGPAVGGGAGLVAGADLAVAGASLKFGYPELKHNIVAALVMTGLSRAVGRKQAFELLALRRLLTATEALELGIVNRVVEDEALMTVAMDMAYSIADVHPLAMQTTKELFYRVSEATYPEAMRAGRDVNVIMRGFRG